MTTTPEQMKRTAREVIQRESDTLRRLSLDIHSHPELNFREHYAHDTLTSFLEGRGFAVTRRAYGMDTAFEAVAGSGAPRIAIICEYDALPGIGHGCGHNLISMTGVAAALALQATVPDQHGSIVVLGTPAEEGGGGKVLMIENGAFRSIDAAMMLHPGVGDSAWPSMIAIQTLEVEYFGRNAHAAAAPWQGINALDAIVAAYNSISMMRQQMRPTDRVHGIITEGGMKPNIIPDHTAGEFYIRSRNRIELEELKKKVVGCLEAAATATGCTMELRWTGRVYDDVRTNDAIADAYFENGIAIGLPLLTKDESRGVMAASTDMGNVSYEVPSIHPFFDIAARNGNHTPEFTEAAATEYGHKAALGAASAMAMTAIDLYTKPELLAAATKEFREQVQRS